LSVAHPVVVGDEVRVRVRALASGGAGVADLPDGRVVFVHRTAPGDEVSIRVHRVRPRWARGTLVRVEAPGPERRMAPCPLYGSCGGCTLQHLIYGAQLAWKSRFVADALGRIGGVDVDPPPVAPSPVERGYRNRVSFTLRRLGRGRVVAGFHALEQAERLVDVRDECLLPETPLLWAWSSLRDAWGSGAGRLPPGPELRVTLRTLTGGVGVLVAGGPPGWDPGDLLDAILGGRALWHQPEGGAPRLVSGEATDEVWAGERVPVGGRAFLQVNRGAAGPLTELVLRRAREVGTTGARAVDAYCGVGIFGRSLAREGWAVAGIELDAEACAAARHQAPPGFDVVEGRVEDRLSACLPAELVILNPPRTGLDHRVPAVLRGRAAARVVYVSCDPATLARDAARLSPDYALGDVRCFDLFPQTAHVETVAVFSRVGSA
jgi:23S rRNA (uracil1939-C5)-methyltransferase